MGNSDFYIVVYHHINQCTIDFCTWKFVPMNVTMSSKRFRNFWQEDRLPGRRFLGDPAALVVGNWERCTGSCKILKKNGALNAKMIYKRMF